MDGESGRRTAVERLWKLLQRHYYGRNFSLDKTQTL